MNAVLISALTAAVVTLLIEYAAKPHLEARKDRIVEAHRLRREWAARLLQITHQVPYVLGLVYPRSWKTGQAVLEKCSSEAAGLLAEFPKVSQSMSKRQRSVVQNLLSQLFATTNGLQYLVALHDAYNFVDLGPPDQKIRMADYIENEIQKAVILIGGAHTVLSISRRRPWSYCSMLKYWSDPPLSKLQPDETASDKAANSSQRAS